jgi:hypothetical protein
MMVGRVWLELIGAGFCLSREEDGDAMYKLNDECMYCNCRGTIKT